jgi:chromosome segregation ATPase
LTIEDLTRQLQAQQEQLAKFQTERASLEQEREQLQGQKQNLAVLSLIENDKAAGTQLKAASTRLFDIGQRVESLDFASSELKLRIAASENLLKAAEQRGIAGEVAELIRAQVKDATKFEKALAEAVKCLDGIHNRGLEVNQKVRQIDPALANQFTSKTLGSRVEERLTSFFKRFGAKELFAVRDTPLPDQLAQGLDYFESMAKTS